MNKSEFITAMNTHKFGGFELDRFGHYQRTVTDRAGKAKVQRLKVGANSVRIEVKVVISGGQYSADRNEWVRINTGYYSKMTTGQVTLEHSGLKHVLNMPCEAGTYRFAAKD